MFIFFAVPLKKLCQPKKFSFYLFRIISNDKMNQKCTARCTTMNNARWEKVILPDINQQNIINF